MANPKPPEKTPAPMLRQRQKMFLAGFILWLCLAAWTLSAFWFHLETTVPEKYFWMSALGAAAGEFAALFFLYEYCFVKKIRARKIALVCSFLMGAVLLLHCGAVRGIEGAKAEQINAEQRYAENAKKLIGANTTRTGTRSANQAAAKELKELTKEGKERVENSSIFPAWYIRDWVYSALFICALLLFFWYEWEQVNDESVDTNYDGIDDRQQNLQPAMGEA